MMLDKLMLDNVKMELDLSPKLGVVKERRKQLSGFPTSIGSTSLKILIPGLARTAQRISVKSRFPEKKANNPRLLYVFPMGLTHQKSKTPM